MSHFYNNFMSLSSGGKHLEPSRHRRFFSNQSSGLPGIALISRHEKTSPFW